MSIIHLASTYSVNAHSLGIPTNVTTLNGGMSGIIKLLVILVGMGSVTMVVVGGLQIVLSAGNPAHVKRGRETVIYSLIGVVISAMAYVIVSYLSGQLK